MTVNAISNDGRHWQFLRSLRADPPTPAVADAGASPGIRFLGGGPAAAGLVAPWSPAIATAAASSGTAAPAAAAGGQAPGWLGALESAGSTLVADLQAFLADLQGAAQNAAGAAPASATADPATAGTAATTAAGAAPTGPTPTSSGTTGSGTTTATDAGSLIAALQSFIGLLQGGSAAGNGGADGHGRHHHDGDGGGGGGWAGSPAGGSAGIQTTNLLLGGILGVLESYAGGGAGSASPVPAQSGALQTAAGPSPGTSISV
jgi:hypothetical protein